jgi:hypothetical protein
MNRSSSTSHPAIDSAETFKEKSGTSTAWRRRLNRPNFFAAVIFASLVILSTMNLGRLNWVVILLMGLAATVYLFNQGRGAREIFFRAHVRESSRLQKFRVGYLFVLLVAFGGGFTLAVSLVVFLLTVHWVVLAAVVAVQFFFVPVRARLLSWLHPHLKLNSQALLSNFLTVATLGATSVIVLIVAKWVEMKFFIPDAVIANVDFMAARVIARVSYDIIWVQHLARTLSMFELELLSAHRFAVGWVAQIILIYFLLPSTLAAFALPVIYAGLNMACRGEKFVANREARR